MLMPLIQGTHLKMPRTFLVGIGGLGVASGLYFVYVVLIQRTRIAVDMNSKRVIEGWRKFGISNETSKPLVHDAVILRDYSTSLQGDRQHGRASRAVYIIELKNGSSRLKLYNGLVETEAQAIIDFFDGNGVACVETSTPFNKWGAIGTVLFLAALFAELNFTGAPN